MDHEERTLMDRNESTAVLPQSSGPSSVDVADDVERRRRDTYSQGDSEGVAVLDGWGARMVVERGHLELHDGVGQDRRVRRYAKVDPPRRVVVGIGTAGTVSLEALRWCAATGTPVVVLSNDGAILASGPPGREDARLLRAQALALYGSVGLEIGRYLIAEKLKGQARVLRYVFDDQASADTVTDLAEAVELAKSLDEIIQNESVGANVYFAAWEKGVRVVFAGRDVPRIPSHWSRFNGRRSSVNPGSPRSATDPAGALLNYAYRLAEIEAGLAARRMGLDPGIGCIHADQAGRPSFACDLMEAVRPVVDLHVLGMLSGPLRKREFTEDARGVVRILAPLTHRLAEAMPSYAENLAPVVETVALLLAGSSPYDVKVPTALSRSKHKAAARRRVDKERAEGVPQKGGIGPNPGGIAPRGTRRAKPTLRPPLPPKACRGCGGQLPVEDDRIRQQAEWCPACLPQRRGQIGSSLPERSRQAAELFAAATGTLPAHTEAANLARSASNRNQRTDELAWEAQFGETFDLGRDWWKREVVPKLATLTLPMIAKATGVSTSAASHWRGGRKVPHRRHWAALGALVGVKLPRC
jgi:CRISPR-associated protein Cas1